MSNNDEHKSEIGYVQRCGGIPMYPHEYRFDMDRPKGISDEEILNRKISLNKFLEKYGLHLDLDKY